MELLEKESKITELGSSQYPELLSVISSAPKVLYYKGDISTAKNCFAVVGARKCSDYGKKLAYSISYNLAKAGLTIVSGLAHGIDSSAHKGALDAKGKTIAILGTGLDPKVIYPQENLKLAEEILKRGGCLISEYPESQRGAKFTFPKRNRLISGISFGVLVVEAKEKSGALITAEWARKQGRKVFAVPGPIDSLSSKGPHLLIKQGAFLVESTEDILEKLGIKPLTQAQKKIYIGHIKVF